MEVSLEQTLNRGTKEEFTLDYIGQVHEADEDTGFNRCADLVQVFYTKKGKADYVDITDLFFELSEGAIDIELIEEELAEK